MQNEKSQFKIQNYFLKFIGFLFVILISNLLFLIFSFAAVPEDLKRSIDVKAQELEKINRQIEETQQKIETTQEQGKTLKKEVQRLDYNISQADLGIRSGELKIQQKTLEIESLQYELGDVRSGIKNSVEAVSQLLRSLQERDRESLLVGLLRNKTLAASVFELRTIDDISRSLSDEIGKLKNSQNRLQNVLEETNHKKNQMESEKKSLKYCQTLLTDQKRERQSLLAQTKNQETSYQQQLKELEKKQQEISDEIDKIEDELRTKFDSSLLPLKRPGVLAVPLTAPRVTQFFGENSRLYGGKPHNGMDFGAIVGTEIYAADDGEVMAVGNNGKYQYGKFVLIRHPNNLATLYAHLSQPMVSQGSQVKRGQLIGLSGNTGYTVGRGHLHLGLYWAPSVLLKNLPYCNCGPVPIGVTLDPRDYLAR